MKMHVPLFLFLASCMFPIPFFYACLAKSRAVFLSHDS